MRAFTASIVTLFFCQVLGQHNCNIDANATAEKRLRSKLLCDYDPNVIPLNPPEVTKIQANISLDLKHISINEEGNTLKVTAWITSEWHDGYLRWNKSEYGEIKKIVISDRDIWTPDLSVYNSDMTQTQLFTEKTICIAEFDGYTSCAPNLNTPIYCKADLTRWPYDVQECVLEIGTWAYTKEEVVVQKSSLKGYTMQDQIYFKNNLWDVKSIKGQNIKVNSFMQNYVRWTFTVQRHSGLYEATYIMPAFVLAAMTLLSFWAKPLQMRALLCCCSLICNAFFISSLAREIRAIGEAKPDIVAAYRDSLIFTLISLAFSILIPLLSDFDSPNFLITFADLLKNRAGKTGSFLLGQDLENSVDDVNSDMTVVIGSSGSERPKCIMFTTLLDRTAFVVLAVLYAMMLMALMP